jgi:hypothetical protein
LRFGDRGTPGAGDISFVFKKAFLVNLLNSNKHLNNKAEVEVEAAGEVEIQGTGACGGGG